MSAAGPQLNNREADAFPAFDDVDLMWEPDWLPPAEPQRPRRRRKRLIAGLVAIGIIGGGAVAIAATGVMAPSDSNRTAVAPTSLRVLDRGTEAVLTWDDPNGGRVLYGLLGGDPYRQLLPMGAVTTTVVGLDPAAGVCFRIAAVAKPGDWSLVSPQACVREGSDVVVPPSPAAVAAAETDPSAARTEERTPQSGQGTAVTPPPRNSAGPSTSGGSTTAASSNQEHVGETGNGHPVIHPAPPVTHPVPPVTHPVPPVPDPVPPVPDPVPPVPDPVPPVPDPVPPVPDPVPPVPDPVPPVPDPVPPVPDPVPPVPDPIPPLPDPVPPVPDPVPPVPGG